MGPQDQRTDQTTPTQTATSQNTNSSVPPADPTVMSSATPAPEQNSSKRTLYIILAVLGTLLLAGLLFLALGGGKDEETETPTKRDTPAAVAPEKKEQSTTSSAEEIPLGKTISDPQMGYTIEAVSMSIGKVAIPEKFASAQSGKTAVAVTFKITDSGKFAGSGKNLLLRLVDSSNTSVSNSTSISKAEIASAGYKPLTEATETNNVVEGTHVYWVDSDNVAKLTLNYKRMAASVVGSTETIPAKEFTVELR